ncbi:DNA-binding transcriptional regulator, GntR family [Cohaesibacter sp. ES.047]|uniref:GntR family transcriptional regulator n=1 Tax=Cohaesibacter sp. ES.047 TaxID=1798205 RepID=UPI000BB8D6E8|nr:GntR family transcriptional regulator [Cohaesibacter sp. ES.047]SNY90263.1 DNA-binding transcriptional regulator, GntR family [Cohaesibacter sp. ES.047]
MHVQSGQTDHPSPLPAAASEHARANGSLRRRLIKKKAESILRDRPTLESVIYDELYERIVTLKYVPGHMIYENEIAAQFDVSRTPVRQVFQRLVLADLLEVLPQRGARVSFLSKRKIRESQEVREILETVAVAKAAQKWRAEDEESQAFSLAIKASILRQIEVVADKNYHAFSGLDEDFHRAIMRFADNMTIYDVVGEIRAHLNRMRVIELQHAHLDAEAIEFHKRIIAEIEAGDAEGAREQMLGHLKVLEQFREEIFANRNDIFV